MTITIKVMMDAEFMHKGQQNKQMMSKIYIYIYIYLHTQPTDAVRVLSIIHEVTLLN